MASITPASPKASNPSQTSNNLYLLFKTLIRHAALIDTRIHVLAADSPQREHLPRPIEIRSAALDGGKEAAVFGAISGQFLKRDEELCWDQVCEFCSISPHGMKNWVHRGFGRSDVP